MHGSEGLEGTTRPQMSIKPTRIAATIERQGPTSSRTTFRRAAQRQEDHVTSARSFASERIEIKVEIEINSPANSP